MRALSIQETKRFSIVENVRTVVGNAMIKQVGYRET